MWLQLSLIRVNFTKFRKSSAQRWKLSLKITRTEVKTVTLQVIQEGAVLVVMLDVISRAS